MSTFRKREDEIYKRSSKTGTGCGKAKFSRFDDVISHFPPVGVESARMIRSAQEADSRVHPRP